MVSEECDRLKLKEGVLEEGVQIKSNMERLDQSSSSWPQLVPLNTISRQGKWKQRKRALERELASTKFRINPGGSLHQSPKTEDLPTSIKSERGGDASILSLKPRIGLPVSADHLFDLYGNNSMVKEATIKWPVAVRLRQNSILRFMILDAAIQDMKKVLSSKQCPTGQDFTRYHQVFQFMNTQRVNHSIGRVQLAVQVADGYQGGAKLANAIQIAERDWVRERYIVPGKKGRTSAKVRSMLEDQGTLLAVREWLVINGSDISSQGLADFVVGYWRNIAKGLGEDGSNGNGIDKNAIQKIHGTLLKLQHLGEAENTWSLTSRSAVTWLHRLGYDWKQVRKGLYKDGHERADVLIYRNEKYLPFLDAIKPRLIQWNEEGEMIHSPADIWSLTGQCPVVLVTHDECTFYSNDGPTYQWIAKGSQAIRKKSLGKSIMLSGFLTPISTLRAPDHIDDSQLNQLGLRRDTLEMIECGGDLWWDSDKLAAQITDYAIPIFELQFPGCQALFLFDNAPSHHSWPSDSLRAYSMNFNPGGKTPKMRDGWYINSDGIRVTQSMIYKTTDDLVPVTLDGQPKGLKIILKERGLLTPNLKHKCKSQRLCDATKIGGCCARSLMSLQPDFQEQKSRLEELIQSRGHLSILFPKYHCELNWIEHYWGATKWYTRKNCKYTMSDLRKRIPEGLKYADSFIWKFWNRTEKIAQAYREGAGWGAEVTYKSHRRINISSRDGLAVDNV